MLALALIKRSTRIMPMRAMSTPCYPPAPAIWTIPDASKLNAEVQELHKQALITKAKLDSASWMTQFRIRFGYTSNKIEDNAFSEEDVQNYLNTGATISGRSSRDHAEIHCHNNAIDFIFENMAAPLSNITTVEFVCNLHKICMPPPTEREDPIPGMLKTVRNMTGCTPPGEVVPVYRRFVHPADTRDQLFELLKWCEQCEAVVPILPFITLLHYNFVRIHPFTDTNGRTSRLLNALFMLRRNFPPLIIDPEDRKAYMAALTYADFKQDLNPLMEFFMLCMRKTYKELDQLVE